MITRTRVQTLLLVGISIISISAISRVYGDMATNEFSMGLRLGSPVATVKAPIPIEITVTYQGSERIDVRSLEGSFLELTISAPKSWEPKPISRIQVTDGWPGISSLTHGGGLTRIVDLHDFFARIPLGKAELSFTLNLWTKSSKGRQKVVLNRAMTLDISDEPAKSDGDEIGARTPD